MELEAQGKFENFPGRLKSYTRRGDTVNEFLGFKLDASLL